MEIFANWIFWVVIATVIFVFALIGFLTDKKKKSKDKSKMITSMKDVKVDSASDSAVNVSGLESQLNMNTGLNASNAEVTVPNSEIPFTAGGDTSLDENLSAPSLEENTSVDRNQVSVNTLDMSKENSDASNTDIQSNDSVNTVSDSKDVEVDIVPNEADASSNEVSDVASNDTNANDVWN